MKDKGYVDDVEVKKANIAHHNMEAEIFERVHPEGSSIYERSIVSRSIAFIRENSNARNLCVDVGCGTGFVTGFEVPLYKAIIATDISRRMLEVARRRLGRLDLLDFVVCDAEHLPFKNGVVDLVSASSVLHHLPKPFSSIEEISRILKKDGFVYITREPSLRRMRRFFDSFDYFVVRKFLKFMQIFFSESKSCELNAPLNELGCANVDVHYPIGFYVTHVAEALRQKRFKVVCAYSYHWVLPYSTKGLLSELLTRSNFVIDKIPLSNRFGRYVSIIAKKEAKSR